MKLEAMEGRVGCQDLFPGKHHKHYDVIKANSTGGLLLGCSNRNSRKWVGSLWYYEEAGSLLDPFKCSSAVSIPSGVNDVCWVSEKIFVAALDSGAVASWEVNVEEAPFMPLWEAREHDGLVRSVTYGRTEKRVVSAAYDGRVKIWDLENENIGNCLHTYRGHSDIIHCVDHHHTLPLFATCSLDGTVIVWDTRLPKPAKRFMNFASVGPTSVRWMPNSDNLLIGDSNGNVHFGDLKNVEKMTVSKIHTELITDMEFSANGNLIVTGSQDGGVKVSKICDGNLEATVTGKHKDYVQNVTFRNEEEAVSCAYDGQILRHNLGVASMELNGHEENQDSPED